MKGPAQGGGGGEIVPIDGGHIIRSIGRKDRHSKVYTAKGPRDRRVRLSAHTAIQFYDVQDRLGYDRPSKAVDWLIRKAQAAIESLNETTPPPQPPWHAPTPDSNPSSSDLALEQQNSCDYNFQHNNHNSRCGDSTFMGETDLMNTMKSFFPAAGFGSFENVPCQGGASFPAEDLGLSLQTFQAGSHSNSDIPFHGSFQRIDGWNGGGGIFPTFAQRELLQSNTAAAAAANPWNQRPLISANHHDNGDHRHLLPRNDFGLGFRVPARIYGEDEAPENRR